MYYVYSYNQDRVITKYSDDEEKCLELTLAIQAIVYWLLSCMYSSLENLSDMSDLSETVEVEDSKIVTKCRKLLEFFLTDSFLNGLLHVAAQEDPSRTHFS
jgi:hypothetical protein